MEFPLSKGNFLCESFFMVLSVKLCSTSLPLHLLVETFNTPYNKVSSRNPGLLCSVLTHANSESDMCVFTKIDDVTFVISIFMIIILLLARCYIPCIIYSSNLC